MECPYCAEDIKDQAIACKHCRRDFFVIQPLLAKLNTANERIRVLEEQIEATLTLRPSATEQAAEVASKVDNSLPSLPITVIFLLTFTSLVLAHYLMIVLFDMRLIFLRVASMLIPLLFALFARDPMKRHLFVDLSIGFIIGVAAILAMSAIVSNIDGIPILPQDRAGWREVAEYTASMSFGFLTGSLIRRAISIIREPSTGASLLVEMLARLLREQINADGKTTPKDKIDAQIKTLRVLSTGAITMGTAIVSVYTGIANFLR